MRARLRTYLIAGLLVVLPVAVTVAVLRALFRVLDSVLAPVFALAGLRVPGLGLLSGVALILLAGAMASNVLGRRLVEAFDRFMLRIPLARSVYAATKQLADSILHPNRMALKEAVLVEWPRKGLYTVGFVTGEGRGEIRAVAGERVVSVFIMTTPNPTSGFVCLVPESQVVRLQMSIEDALKLVVSGGIVAPPETGRPVTLGRFE
ncbi:MAG: DUF502 domain-containing protein [Firmicutes bacterium]|nr:DUF502 domain-containing protein [Bacillota bacterium]